MRSSNVTAAALRESFCLCETPQKRESFWSSDGSAAVFLLRAPLLNAPLQKHGLEGKIEAATEHSEIIFRPVDHAEAQVVSQTDVPRDSEFETGSELAERFGFATEVVRLGVDSERIRRPLCGEDIPFAAAEPGVIASDVSVVGAEHRVAFTGTLYDIH